MTTSRLSPRPAYGCALRNKGKLMLHAVKIASSLFVSISCFLIAIFLQSHSLAQNASGTHRPTRPEARVPFVGCPSDGQQGPLDASPPRDESEVVAVSPEIARRLAYYKAYDSPRILAPRGWHCFGTYGSNGSNLYVTPEPINGKEVLLSSDWKGFTGAAIQISEMLTGTSGRFSAAKIIALVFPAHMAFAENVISDKPTHRRAGYDVPGEMLLRGYARAYHQAGQ